MLGGDRDVGDKVRMMIAMVVVLRLEYLVMAIMTAMSITMVPRDPNFGIVTEIVTMIHDASGVATMRVFGSADADCAGTCPSAVPRSYPTCSRCLSICYGASMRQRPHSAIAIVQALAFLKGCMLGLHRPPVTAIVFLNSGYSGLGMWI